MVEDRRLYFIKKGFVGMRILAANETEANKKFYKNLYSAEIKDDDILYVKKFHYVSNEIQDLGLSFSSQQDALFIF